MVLALAWKVRSLVLALALNVESLVLAVALKVQALVLALALRLDIPALLVRNLTGTHITRESSTGVNERYNEYSEIRQQKCMKKRIERTPLVHNLTTFNPYTDAERPKKPTPRNDRKEVMHQKNQVSTI